MELDVFNLKLNVASDQECKPFYKIRDSRFYRNVNDKIPFLFKSNYFQEFGFKFANNLLSQPDNTYIDGFWQNENYFKPSSEAIRSDFLFRPFSLEHNNKLANDIDQCESLSIHVRRSDYVSNAQVLNYHGVCNVDYYKSSVNFLIKDRPNIKLFAFSDDPEWVRTNLHFDYPFTIVSHNTAKSSVEDMHLMSLCKHNIIANSSFSWWSAWLNKNPHKVIIAPKIWFQDKLANTSEIIPKEWIKL